MVVVRERRKAGQLIHQHTEAVVPVVMMLHRPSLMMMMVMVPSAELLTEVEVVVYGVPVGVSFVADEVVVLAPVKLFHSNVKLLDRLPSSEFRWSKLRFRNRLGDRRPGDDSEPIPDELTTPGPVGSSASPSVIPCREPPSKATAWEWCWDFSPPPIPCSTSSESPSPSSSSSSSSIRLLPVASAASTSKPTSDPSTPLSPVPSARGQVVAAPVLVESTSCPSWSGSPPPGPPPVVFSLLRHLARRFWNQTWTRASVRSMRTASSSRKNTSGRIPGAYRTGFRRPCVQLVRCLVTVSGPSGRSHRIELCRSQAYTASTILNFALLVVMVAALVVCTAITFRRNRSIRSACVLDATRSTLYLYLSGQNGGRDIATASIASVKCWMGLHLPGVRVCIQPSRASWVARHKRLQSVEWLLQFQLPQ
uniref:Uncharacterized protein n=1 Tax=Anopheles merus TaxID=30066 RepID=A0A182VPH2_ANOME